MVAAPAPASGRHPCFAAIASASPEHGETEVGEERDGCLEIAKGDADILELDGRVIQFLFPSPGTDVTWIIH